MQSEKSGRASTLAVAIERQDWELAALCLLVGMTRAAEKLPADSVEALIEMLAEPAPEPRRAPHHRRRNERRGRR